MRTCVHGTLVAYLNHGLLIQGEPGIGKSRWAKQALDKGFRLVADDLVILINHNNLIFGFAPKRSRGKLMISDRLSNTFECLEVPYQKIAPICLIGRFVEGESGLQTVFKAPTIDSEYLLGKIMPEVILPKDPLRTLPKTLKKIIQKVCHKN